MIRRSVSDEVLEALRRLGDREQRKVLEYVRGLSAHPPEGASAADLTSFLGAWSEEDASAIGAAIEEGCERVNQDAW